MNGCGAAWSSVRALGSVRGMRVLRSALRGRRSDAAARRRLGRRGVERARVPGEAEGAEPAPGGGLVRFARASLRVEVVVGGAVFVGWDGAAAEPSYALAGAPPPPDVRAFLEPDKDGGWRVVSERALVTVSRLGAVEVRTPGGALLRRELPPRWWESEGPGAERWDQRAELAPDARLFGLGARGGPGLADGVHRLWNEVRGPCGALTMPVQFAVADAGAHLVFHDNQFAGELSVRHGVEGLGSGLDRPGRCEVRMSGGPVRYWVVAGAPARVLRGWTLLTGAPAAPPAWALGHHRAPPDGARDAEVLEAVRAWEAAGLPSAVVELGSVEAAAGEAGGLVAALRGLGVRTTAGREPAVRVRQGAGVYDEGVRAGVFVRDARGLEVRGAGAHGEVAYPDFTLPRARGWWASAYRPDGPDGYLHRRDQPASPAPFAVPALPRSARHSMEGRGGDHGEAHNVYPLEMARAGAEALRSLRPGQRPFLASESGWAGMQRYGSALVAAGSRGWDGLREALAAVIALGLCGVPFSGPLLGGPEAEDDAELLLRGLELGSHLPLFRTSAVSVRWRPDGSAARSVLAERRRLQPYLLTLAHLAERSGAPCVRPVWWQHPGDRELRGCDDVFLLGDALLVAPVLRPGVRRRAVVLPRGRWYETSSGRAHEGPGTVLVDAPLGRTPVLARAGAAVPVADGEGRTVLEVWPPGPGRRGSGLVLAGGDEDARPEAERFVVDRADGRVRVVREGGGPVGYRVCVRGEG